MLDKLKVIENIKRLAKMKNIPIADIEKAGKVSTGYLARLAIDISKFREGHAEGDKERQLPPTDVIEGMASKLGITIDALLNNDFSEIKDAEGSVIMFLDNLTKLTNRNVLIWRREPDDFVTNGKPYGEFPCHPLSMECTESDFDLGGNERGTNTVYKYYSHFLNRVFDEDEFLLYKLTYRNRTFMIAEIISQQFNAPLLNRFEFYEIAAKNVVKIAAASNNTRVETPKFKALESLFDAAKKSVDINPSGDDIVKLIDEYMDLFKLANALDETDKKGEEE